MRPATRTPHNTTSRAVRVLMFATPIRDYGPDSSNMQSQAARALPPGRACWITDGWGISRPRKGPCTREVEPLLEVGDTQTGGPPRARSRDAHRIGTRAH